MDPRLRHLTTPRSDVESAYEDVAPHRDQTPAERLIEAAALSRMAHIGYVGRWLETLLGPEDERVREVRERFEKVRTR